MLYFIISELKRFEGSLSEYCSDVLRSKDHSLHLVSSANRKLWDLEVENFAEEGDAGFNDAAALRRSTWTSLFCLAKAEENLSATLSLRIVLKLFFHGSAFIVIFREVKWTQISNIYFHLRRRCVLLMMTVLAWPDFHHWNARHTPKL